MTASREQAYLFRHAVMQEVAYQLQPPTERSRLHGWIVHIVETLFPDEIEEHALALANHAFHAHQNESSKSETRNLRNKEVQYLLLAAEIARRRYDNEQAIEMLIRVAGLAWTSPTDLFNSLETAARLLLESGKFADAADLIQQLLDVARRAGTPAEEAKALLLLAQIAGVQGRVADAIVYAEQAEYHAGRSTDRSLQLRLYNDMGTVSFRRGETQKAIAQFEQAVKLARELDASTELVSALNRAGATCAMEGNLEKGEALLEEAAELAIKYGDLRNLAAVRSNQGVMCRRGGRYQDALVCYQESREISLRIGLRDNLVNCTDNRGVVLNLLGRLEEAEQAHTEAGRLARELGDRRREATSTLNASLIQRKLGNTQRAIEMMNYALDLQRKETDLRGQINSLINLGNIRLFDQKLAFEALHDYIRAEMLAEQINSKYEAAAVRLRQAQVLNHMQRYNDAISVCRSVLDTALSPSHTVEIGSKGNIQMAIALKETGLIAEAREAAMIVVKLASGVEYMREELETAHTLLSELDDGPDPAKD